ncbi:glycosyltransferase family 87 protein [Paraburkholderia sp. J12]|uniref:glycosyltransferase family 87 protein n=1 Tax=Paraburkholderia sp. J12 TaxID=2805432 RepID=UPI002ABD8985|nr:glycosyltransferase family 87 protein [Paraburkholderia sp. J12]
MEMRRTSIMSDRAVIAPLRWLTRERVALYGAACLVLQVSLMGIWAIAYWCLHVPGIPLPGSDFRVFWCASQVSLHHGALAAFDQSRMLACEAELQAGTPLAQMFGPWVYPPPFQLLVYPLAGLRYASAYAAFMSVNAGASLLACVPAMRSRPLPWVVVLAFPGFAVIAVHGQNSLLTLALAAGALGLLDSSPVWAGLCAGLLVIKPQLAPLFPLLFLCGGHYRALAAAIGSAACLCAVSVLAFGWPLWLACLHTLAWFQGAALDHDGGHLWRAMPTVFAVAKQMGVAHGTALALHGAIAAAAVGATALAWHRRMDRNLRAAAAIVAALLIPPYLVYYELAWLLLPVIYLCAYARSQRGPRSSSYAAYALAAAAWCAPLIGFLAILLTGTGQWAVLLLPLMLAAILHQAFRRSPRRRSNNAPLAA